MTTDELGRSLRSLLSELAFGAPGSGASVLNPADPGLLGVLDALSAAEASASRDGGGTLAAHVDHLRYGLSLMNLSAAGETPSPSPDWSKSWEIREVSEAEWARLRRRLRDEVEHWYAALRQPREVAGSELDGLIGSIAHVAYHLGAIRQIAPETRGPRAQASGPARGQPSGHPERRITASTGTTRVFTHLWYAQEAEEAARFYASIFPDSGVDRVATLMSDSPSGPAGSVKVVDFTLLGQRFQAISAGPHHDFNDAISMVVLCDDQEELDRYWSALLAGGGQEQACGWLNDRFGLRWQIVPRSLDEMMYGDDPAASKRVTDALLKMVKLDIAELEAAYRG